MDARVSKLIELIVEALLIAWLGYLTVYQNYILYHWHRGLPLPSRYPSLVAGIIMGTAFFWYEWDKFERESAREKTPSVAEEGEQSVKNEVDGESG